MSALRRIAVVVTVAVLSVLSSVTVAQADNKEDARRLFLAGRQAYQEGRFDVASTSFEAAYKLEPLPALLFNLAQTYRKQYLVSQATDQLRRAVDGYRKYLTDAPTGPNREAALQGLSDLTPILARVAPEGKGGKGGTTAAAAPAAKTEVMIVTEAAGGKVTLDGAAEAQSAPLLAEVKAGEHKARVEAPGYFPTELRLTAVEGRLVVGEARLMPMPGRIAVAGESGARVIVDGRGVGQLPLAPVEVAPGRHTIAVAGRGREPWLTEVSVEQGKQSDLKAQLHSSSQRRAVKWVALVTVLLGAATGAAGAVWGQADIAASTLESKRNGGSITPDQLAEYNADRGRRDDWRIVTSVGIGATALMALITTGLFVFDNPDPPRQTLSPLTPTPTPSSATTN